MTMNMLGGILLILTGPPIAAPPTAAPPVPVPPSFQQSLDMAVPVRVVGPEDEPQARHAEVSVFALNRQADRLRRGNRIAGGTTGPKGEPCTVRLAPSSDPLLVEAREVGSNGAVLGSIPIAFDHDRSVWRPQTGIMIRRPHGVRPIDIVPERARQETISVKIPERAGARVYIVASQHERLPNFPDVMVLTTSGQVVRRGSPRPTGEGFDVEQYEPLDPGYRRLWVVAKGWQDGRWLTGSALLVFDHNNWRPATVYEQFDVAPDGLSGQWQSTVEYDTATAQFSPVFDGGSWTPPQIRVLVPVRPLGVWKSGQLADAAPASTSSCCQTASQTSPTSVETGVLEELGLGKEPLASAAMDKIASRDAAIVEAGRPLVPEHKWADFTRRWVRGPLNMYWQAPLDSDQF